MAYTGSVTSVETARRASMCVFLGAQQGLIADGDLTSLAAAQAAVAAAELLKPIGARVFGVHVIRALKVGADFGASVTGSSLATFYDGLPANNSHTERMIS